MPPMQRLLHASALVLACSGGPAFAQRASGPEAPCQGLTNAPAKECFDREYKKARDRMGSFLLQINHALTDPEDRKRLGKAQAAWIKDSDLKCDAASRASFRGDTEFVACLAAESSLRLTALHAIYDSTIKPTGRYGQ
jgi:uncharacterized protein YecT (DUF1311 family)